MKKVMIISLIFFYSLVAMEDNARQLQITEITIEEDYERTMETIEKGIEAIIIYRNKNKDSLSASASVNFTDQLALLQSLKEFAHAACDIDYNLKENNDLKKHYESITTITTQKLNILRLGNLKNILSEGSEQKSESKKEKKKWWGTLKRKNKIKIQEIPIEKMVEEDTKVPKALSNLLSKSKRKNDNWTLVLQEIQTWVEREYKKRMGEEKE